LFRFKILKFIMRMQKFNGQDILI